MDTKQHSKDLWRLIPAGQQIYVKGALILVLVFVAYLPSLKPEFIWDDDTAVFRNPLVRADNGLYYLWCTKLSRDYWPLTYTSFWVEWRLWGENAVGYRATNVLLHAFAAILLWRVLRRLQIRGCWWAALIYGLHPVCVASAAWITERKNTLSLLFFLASVLWYMRSREKGEGREQSAESRGPRSEVGEQKAERRREKEEGENENPRPLALGRNSYYALSLFAFLLALVSKTSVVVLPLVLLICIAWQEKVVRRSDWLKLAPFFVLAFVFGAVTVWFQQHGAIGSSGGPGDPLLVRLLAGSRALWFYLWKALIPLNLSVLYDKWSVSAGSWLAYVPALGWVALLALAWFFRRSVGRGAFLALVYFTVCLLPVAGFFDVYYFRYSWVADHWQYLALIGMVVAAVSSFIAWSQDRARSQTWLQFVPPALALCFGWLTWQRAALYGNSESLWQDALKKSPHSWVACNNLANTLDDKGRAEDAVNLYRRALEENPNYAEAHNNLGTICAGRGDQAGALAHYREALRINPGFAEAHNNLASLLLGQGKTEEARSHLDEALRLQPDYADAHYNLGNLLQQGGKPAEAIEQYLITLRLNPGFAEAYFNAGNLRAQQGDFSGAAQFFASAIHTAPGFAQAHYNLGLALSRLGREQEAVPHFQDAMRLNPKLALPTNVVASPDKIPANPSARQ